MLPGYSDIAQRLIVSRRRHSLQIIRIEDAARDLRSGFIRDFVFDLADEYSNVALDQIEHLVLGFLAQNPYLESWYDALLAHNAIEVSFEAGEPLVRETGMTHSLGFAEKWIDLCGWIDADAMIALRFASAFRRMPSTDELEHWGAYARLDAREILAQPLWRRLRDIHTHLSACENVPLLWSELLSGQIAVESLPAYDDGNDAVFGHRSERREEAKIVKAALMDWRSSLAPNSPPLSVDQGRMRHALAPERQMLIKTWLHIDAAAHASPTAADTLRRRFDSYLSAKNAFIRRHIQSPANNPGLEAFRRHFDSLRPYRMDRSDRVLRTMLARWRDFLFDANVLNHVELRIAPCRTTADYARFLDSLESVFRLVSRRAPRPGISGRSMPRFVVHFIRPQIPAGESASGLNIDRLRRQLDREFLALREFLYESEPAVIAQPDPTLGNDALGEREKRLRLRQLIVGIDVANVENNAPIEHYAPYIKFVRGQYLDARAREYLDLGSPYMEATAKYYREGYANARMGRLGLTLHSGEDFFHPIVGLREVWNAVNLCEMRQGDRLGHALALGIDFVEFQRRVGTTAIAPVGQLLDALVWADRRMGALNGVDPRVIRILNDAIDKLCRQIYGTVYRPASLYDAIRLRQFPVARDQYDHAGFHQLTGFHKEAPEIGIAKRDAFEKETQRRRAAVVSVPNELGVTAVAEAFALLQASMLEDVCDRRIVVEMNPSSNRSVGNFCWMRDHPILRAKLRHPSLMVAISTDDPGNFGTRIENEYALVVQGLRDLGTSSEQIEAIIRSMMDVTYAAAFGRSAVSNSPDSWTAPPRHDRSAESVRHDPLAAPD